MNKFLIGEVIIIAVLLILAYFKMSDKNSVSNAPTYEQFEESNEEEPSVEYIIADGDSLVIYENETNYARVRTEDQLPHTKLMRIGKQLKSRSESRIIYFHVNGRIERGDEYAVYQYGTLYDYTVEDIDQAMINL